MKDEGADCVLRGVSKGVCYETEGKHAQCDLVKTLKRIENLELMDSADPKQTILFD